MAEICLPSGYDFKTFKSLSQQKQRGPDFQVGFRATNLATIAMEGLPVLRKWLQEAESKLQANFRIQELPLSAEDLEILKRKVGVLKTELDQYDKSVSKEVDAAIVSYLRDSRLGFFAYTSLLLEDNSGFVEELEFDFRELPSIVGFIITLQVGEVKSSRGYELAVQQIVKRLGVLYMAATHCLPEASRYTFVGKGEIVTALDWINPDDETIKKKMLNAGIKKYPPSLYITVTKLA